MTSLESCPFVIKGQVQRGERRRGIAKRHGPQLGRSGHRTAPFCLLVESASMSSHKQRRQDTAVSSNTQQPLRFACVHKVRDSAVFKTAFDFAGGQNTAPFISKPSVSVLSEMYLNFIFYRVIVYTVRRTTASLLFGNSSSLVWELLPDKQYLG